MKILITNISRALLKFWITLPFFWRGGGLLPFSYGLNLSYLNVTQLHMYSCLITDISNDTTRDMSNETTNPSTNQTNHVFETKKTSSKRITLLFGVVGLKGLSFIIFMLYFYTRIQEKRLLNRTTVKRICS